MPESVTPVGGERVEGPDAKIFHAGTRLDGDRVVSDGGRVLCWQPASIELIREGLHDALHFGVAAADLSTGEFRLATVRAAAEWSPPG